MNDHRLIPDDMKSIIKNISVYDKLLDIEKAIDEKLYKTRLEVQENLIMPSNRVKGLLRTHIYSYIQKVGNPINSNEGENLINNNHEKNLNNKISSNNIIPTQINENNISKNINGNINIKSPNKDNHQNNPLDNNDVNVKVENSNQMVVEFNQFTNNNFENNNPNNYPEYSKTNSSISSAVKMPNNIHTNQPNEKYNWVLRIQGKLIPILDSQTGGFYRKFSYYFNKIIIKFSSENNEKYQDIDWSRVPNSDIDSFEIKRPIEDFEKFKNGGIKIKIIFFVNYLYQEFKIKEELANIIGITQDTRPRILNHIWQYMKINSLQDNEVPNIVNLNRELQKVFKTEKLDLSTLTAKLSDYLKRVEPNEIDFHIKSNEDWNENQKLYDFIINVDDPHFLDISNFLSNIDNESILFPKSLFFYKNENQQKNEKSQQSIADSFYSKISDYDRNIQDLIEKLKKLKYKYDFFEAYSKDPKRFIDNFLHQQNSLLKIMKEESSIIDARWDYYSAQYYKDYEVNKIFLIFLIRMFLRSILIFI